MSLEQYIAEAETAHEEAKRERDLVDEKIHNLEVELEGLRLAKARRNGHVPVADGWQKLGRSSAVERVLRESDYPLGPKQIQSQLLERGRNDRYELVSAALSYLKRVGRVKAVGNAKYSLASEKQPNNDETTGDQPVG